MKPIKMKDLKKGNLFTHAIRGRGRKSFTVTNVGLKQITCIETVDLELVHNKVPAEVKKNIKGFVYLLREFAEVTTPANIKDIDTSQFSAGEEVRLGKNGSLAN